jgi:hypothetical protein
MKTVGETRRLAALVRFASGADLPAIADEELDFAVAEPLIITHHTAHSYRMYYWALPSDDGRSLEANPAYSWSTHVDRSPMLAEWMVIDSVMAIALCVVATGQQGGSPQG